MCKQPTLPPDRAEMPTDNFKCNLIKIPYLLYLQKITETPKKPPDVKICLLVSP